MKRKLLIVGHARHGKDTVCEILKNKYGYSFLSSSEFCAERVVFPVLSWKYKYRDLKECFDDRINHRAEWFELISDYNFGDPARLSREIFAKYDIYCGLRNIEELKAAKAEKLYDLCIWVDAGSRVPEIESIYSNTITSSDADYILDNSGSLKDLEENLHDILI